MALDACILIKMGGKEFEGSSRKTGHLKSSSICTAVSHIITTPLDTTHGAMTGRRQHGLLAAEVLLDPSIYQMYNALIAKDKDGSQRLEVTIQFYRANQDNIGLWGAGENAPFYKITLSDAIIVEIEFGMSNTRGQAGPGQVMRGEYAVVKFVYRQIEWMFMQGNKAAMDAWDA